MDQDSLKVLESAQLVVDQNYSVKEAAEAVGTGYSTMDKWVRQLRRERSDIKSINDLRKKPAYLKYPISARFRGNT